MKLRFFVVMVGIGMVVQGMSSAGVAADGRKSGPRPSPRLVKCLETYEACINYCLSDAVPPTETRPCRWECQNDFDRCMRN